MFSNFDKMRWLLFLLVLNPIKSLCQIPIDWAVCIEKNSYYYTNEKLEDFILKKKFIKFCYNHNYFGLNDKGYIQIFPLEAYSANFNIDGYMTESFCNGACENYSRGDLFIQITHSVPQKIIINYSTHPAWEIYIETNQLYSDTIKNYHNRKIVQKPQTEYSYKYAKIRINNPISFKSIYDNTKIDSQLALKLNPDYYIYIENKYNTPFYDFKIPIEKREIFLEKLHLMTKN